MKPVVTMWWWCFGIGVALPGALLVVQAFVPDTLLATAPAGQFRSATVSVGGYWDPTVTTVQTTTATVAAKGRVSAIRGQAMVIERRAKSGLSLCTLGSNHVCATLAGAWPGALKPTGASAPALTVIASDSLRSLARFWIALGCILCVFAGLVAIAVSGRDRHDADDSRDPESTA